MRLFIAINPPERLLRDLETRCDPLRDQLKGRGIHWSPPAQLHFTLQFLGECSAEKQSSIESSIQNTIRDQPGFRVSLVGLGVFPNPARARVLWVGVENGKAPMTTLAERLGLALEAEGFVQEARAFYPHLTLARLEGSPPGLDALLEHYRHVVFGEFTATSVSLVKSTLLATGARYENLGVFSLAS